MSDWAAFSFTAQWVRLLQRIKLQGNSVKPRGQATLELLHNQMVVDMAYPVLNLYARKLGFKFMAAEAWWVLSGLNDVESIKDYGDVAKFSDDGVTFFGAYGPMIEQQWEYLCRTLIEDPDSRQAVATIWKRNPPVSKDIPCTLGVQFLLRRPTTVSQRFGDQGYDYELHCVDTMRSSDTWLGLPYDVFTFTMLTAKLALRLQSLTGWRLKLGTLTMNCGSQHLYLRDMEAVDRVLKDYQPAFNAVEFGPIRLEKWKSETSLMNWLAFSKTCGIDVVMGGLADVASI